ncbi:MBG domain-containing protein [Sphingomonas lycopersici]|uniref:Filamentous hemagglutinin N-terminal domain-containing protein n=1 Tax=Sphingomonas lycopersici TaxID=2951807 RepID=A0AA42CVK2_9SPHN|nr:MBG domain-containing protein [Sphingomonas lycopersici]MCW6536691.1 filamentous hemagglutinin N-terminal domain-containing protein [Sphingomonas lycopersici]
MTRPFSVLLLATSALAPAIAHAGDLPTGGQIVRGDAAIGAPANGAMTISQGSDRAIINWQSFSIGSGNRVDIVQPRRQSVLLNRVTGDTGSTIAGALNANGQVFLVNPNGIQITATGSVRAAGFVASTLDVADDAFMRGDIVVTGKAGRVSNAGTISIVAGGYAALIGGKVDNAGLILAPLGRVALASGSRATLDLAGDGFLQIALPADGGAVGMSGRISVDGGSVLLSAASALDAARNLVNLSGVIEARGVSGRSGSVTLTGDAVALTAATIDVSGAGGGGVVRIGGGRQGGGDLARAATVTVDAGSTIRADAIGSGNGGDVVIWSDRATRFAGTISARGAGSGSGGEVEVSSAGQLDYRGTADLRGARLGTLLLDPYNLTISDDADINAPGFTASGNDSVINATTLIDALALGNVIVSTGTSGGQAGNITLATSLAWASNAKLTLTAANDIILNGGINAAAGGLALDAGGNISASGDIALGSFSLLRGNWQQIGAAPPAFHAADFSLAAGTTFLRALGGTGSAADPWQLADIYGVQGINTLLSGNFALANDIDASGTANWNGGRGFVAIGTNGAGVAANGGNGFTGSLDGRDHMISGLTINRGSNGFGYGLFGVVGAGGMLTAIGLDAANVTGGGDVGALVGRNAGTVRFGRVGGSVTGLTATGGLVGTNLAGGTITDSYSTATVSGPLQQASNLGGFVGENYGSIARAYARGAVSGFIYAGGFAGRNAGAIDQVYATGQVTGGNSGGLIGFSDSGSSLSNSFWDTAATGQGSARGSTSSNAGAQGLTTAQFQDSQAFATLARAWNFRTVWAPPSAGYYPEFYRWSRVLTIIPDAVSRVYGDANPTLTAGYYGLRPGDTPLTQATLSTAANASSGVGSYTIVATGGSADPSYRVVNLLGTLTVTPRLLTITPNAVSRIYGDANPLTGSATGTGLVNGDTITSVRLSSTATGMSGVGGYGLTASNAVGSGLSNYAITYVPLANGLIVSPRALTVTADPVSRVYGSSNPATGTATGIGLVNGDTISAVSLSSPATSMSGIGSYDLTASNAVGTGLGNYTISYVTLAGGLTVTPLGLTLTITPDAVTRLYGDANPTTGTATGVGLIGNDRIDSVSLASTATRTSGIGSYDLVASNAVGVGLGNYTISYQVFAGGLTVTARPLVITANTVSRVYGDANPLTGSATGAGLVNGDTISSVSLSSPATGGSGVGGYDLTASNAVGTGLGNYAISYATLANGLTVTPRALTITANSVSRIYGDANPLTGGATGVGLVNGDTISSVSLSSPATGGSRVGSYDLTASNAVGTGLGNYAISYATLVNGLTVTPRALTITANALSRIYGDANPTTGSATGAGLVNGDTITAVSLSSSATGSSGIGGYDLNASNAIGTGLGNYAISYRTLANGLTVTSRTLYITADSKSILAGAAIPALTYNVQGLVNGDTLSGNLGTTATTTSSAGSYQINLGSLAASKNYNIAFTTGTLDVKNTTGPSPTISPATLPSLDLQGIDIETALMAVQSDRAKLLDSQLARQIEDVQKRSAEIASLNDQITEKTIEYQKKIYLATSKSQQAKLQKELDDIVASLKVKIDALSSYQQIDMLLLQSLTTKRNEAFEVMTKFLEKMQQSRQSIIGNMR